MTPRSRVSIRMVGLCLLALTVAQVSAARDPVEVLLEYNRAYAEGRAKDVYSLASKRDRAARKLSEVEVPDGWRAIVSPTVRLSTEILERSEDRRLVRVTGQIPQTVQSTVEWYFDVVVIEAAVSESAGRRRLREEVQSVPSDPTYVEWGSWVQVVVREDGQWRVFEDWATRDKAAQLRDEAEEVAPPDYSGLTSDHELAGERDALKRALELQLEAQDLLLASEAISDSAARSYQGKIENLRQALARVDEYLVYRDKITFQHMRRGKSTTGETGIFGEVKNTGSRTVVRLKIRTYLLNADGDRISERNYTPIAANNKYIEGSPLRAGYVHSFGYRVDNPPQAWSGGVEAEVLDLELAD